MKASRFCPLSLETFCYIKNVRTLKRKKVGPSWTRTMHEKHALWCLVELEGGLGLEEELVD